MRHIARRLIEEEHDVNDANAAHAAFRVCKKLGESLSVLTGPRGYSALLSRALNRAGEEAPWLNELVVDVSGTLVFPSPGPAAKVSPREAAKGGLALVAHLLELLTIFIGEALTLRLLQQVWPGMSLKPRTN